jgi:hypothetical protein
MKLRNISPKNTKSRLPLIISFVLIVLVTTYGAVAYAQSFWPFNTRGESQEESDIVRPVNSVDYSPSTDVEIENSQDGKKNNAHREDTETNPKPTNKNLITTPVAVAFADVTGANVEVRAFVPQIIEGSGTCTATLTKESVTVTESTEAFIDASSSQCKPILIPISKFPQAGSWSLTVSYLSDTHKGSSEKLEIKLP